MADARGLTVFVSSSADARLAAVRQALEPMSAHRPLTIIGASRGAADDFARRLASSTAATFGLARYSLGQFAARTALLALAREGATPVTALATEAVAARAAFDALQAHSLNYFHPVAGTPGFPRALARTLGELRNGAVAVDRVASLPLVGDDLARLSEHFTAAVAAAGAADRASLFAAATARLRAVAERGTIVLLDLPLETAAERHLVESLVAGAACTLATVARGDAAEPVLAALAAAVVPVDEPPANDLSQLRRYLFEPDEQPPRRTLDGSMELFSAPGEARECVEIARRALREAGRGVRFDEMAVLVRAPHTYFGLLEHAMSRAGVPVWFDRGTRRPHPAGRALLALLACAADRISAVRFAEYLSLGQVPGEAGRAAAWQPPAMEDIAWSVPDRPEDELEAEDRRARTEPAPDDAPVVAGTLRAPWRWEALIVDARIIGGGAERWRRRFEGHRRELQRRLRETERESGSDGADTAAGLRILGELSQLQHLEAFAIPIVETLESWSEPARWGEWIDRFVALVPRVLREPAYVLRVLGELRPMAAVGPVLLDEARRVLADRLSSVAAEPPARRYGRVFVGTPQQARGRTFRVVFVPGLAERLFPQKAREDPLLLDSSRATLDAGLVTEPRRILAERQLLRLAVGAAGQRLYVSYPRLDLSEARARVPSFYALDLLRAATGEVPGHEALQERARVAGDASLAWPAPEDPREAIDEVEHDLAVVRRLLDHPQPETVRGHAHYLLTVSEPLRRSVIERWNRSRPDWSPADGLVRVTAATADVLGTRRLTARAYSPSALQDFAACPYRFVLASFLRLRPLEEPTPLERLDPLTRGSLIHEVQARLMRELRDLGQLPLDDGETSVAAARLDAIIGAVMSRAHEELAPAVERVWRDDVEGMRRDLHGWLVRMAADRDWVPAYFEFAFGRVPGERDPASSPDPVALDGGFSLRGAIDLVEVHRGSGELRVTDYKTGRAPDRLEPLHVGGGAILQPVLYALAAERLLGRRVQQGRLFFCTVAGGYRELPVPLDEAARRAGLEVLEVVDRAIADGHLMVAPADHACERCDFTAVCGPEVTRRVAHKKKAMLADLVELRSRR